MSLFVLKLRRWFSFRMSQAKEARAIAKKMKKAGLKVWQRRGDSHWCCECTKPPYSGNTISWSCTPSGGRGSRWRKEVYKDLVRHGGLPREWFRFEEEPTEQHPDGYQEWSIGDLVEFECRDNGLIRGVIKKAPFDVENADWQMWEWLKEAEGFEEEPPKTLLAVELLELGKETPTIAYPVSPPLKL